MLSTDSGELQNVILYSNAGPVLGDARSAVVAKLRLANLHDERLPARPCFWGARPAGRDET